MPKIGGHSEIVRVKAGDLSPTQANISVFDLVNGIFRFGGSKKKNMLSVI